MDMSPLPESISIMAGNSRLERTSDGRVVVQPQLKAFEAALKYGAQVRASRGTLPAISIAFDHHGIFRKQFLVGGLSNAKERNPVLSSLLPEIVSVFEPAATAHQIPLDAILVIHEDSARSHLEHVLRTETISEHVRRRMVASTAQETKEPDSDAGPSCTRLTCAGITREYLVKANRPSGDGVPVLEVFFEDTEWSRPLAYVRGLQLTHILGDNWPIRLNLVDDQGQVLSADLVHGEI